MNLDELEQLARKATPGPRRALRDGNQYVNTNYLPTARLVGASRIEGLVRPWNPHAYVAFGFKPEEFETVRFIDEDADFIAAANPETVLKLVALARLADSFAEMVENEARKRDQSSRGGQHVTNTGDLASAPPSTLSRLQWWAREIRAALKEPSK